MVVGIAVNCQVPEPVSPSARECPIIEQQIASIVSLTQKLADEFKISAENVLGYGEFYNKFGGPPHKHSNPADRIAAEVRPRLVR
jgi:N-acetyl-anhydromuramyl-L-alanine amidase AmpD